MVSRKKTAPEAIPRFPAEQKAAGFGDEHSPADYPNDYREAEVEFSRPLLKRDLTVKFSDQTLAQLRELAGRQSIGPTTLVRMWILERLRAQRP